MSLRDDGYLLQRDADIGCADLKHVLLDRYAGLLMPQRHSGKYQASDMIAYSPAGLSSLPSIEHPDIERKPGESRARFPLLPAGAPLARAFLDAIPHPDNGQLAVTWLRYHPGTAAGTHQDGFADYVLIYVLARNGTGGESYLLRADGGERVLHRALEPGEILILRDDDFWHGVTEVTSGQREALMLVHMRRAHEAAGLSGVHAAGDADLLPASP